MMSKREQKKVLSDDRAKYENALKAAKLLRTRMDGTHEDDYFADGNNERLIEVTGRSGSEYDSEYVDAFVRSVFEARKAHGHGKDCFISVDTCDEWVTATIEF